MDHKKRTPLMEALCILSFIGNGTAILISLAAAVWNKSAQNWIKEWSSQYDVSRFTTEYFLIFALSYFSSLSGVWYMWKMKKSGFFLYLFSQSVIMIFPSLWSGEPVFPSVVVIFTLLFVVLYAREIFRKRTYSLDP